MEVYTNSACLGDNVPLIVIVISLPEVMKRTMLHASCMWWHVVEYLIQHTLQRMQELLFFNLKTANTLLLMCSHLFINFILANVACSTAMFDEAYSV